MSQAHQFTPFTFDIAAEKTEHHKRVAELLAEHLNTRSLEQVQDCGSSTFESGSMVFADIRQYQHTDVRKFCEGFVAGYTAG